jgi:hypothetical protein
MNATDFWLIHPFTPNMATVAQSYQVSQMVSIFVVGEIFETNDMVNIQMPTVFFFRYATVLTFVMVAFTGTPPLAAPIGTVVTIITALPVVMILSSMPQHRTFIGTKAEQSSALQCSWNNHVFSALFAVIFDRRERRRLGCYKTYFPGTTITFPRAYGDNLGADFKRSTSEVFPANLASQRSDNLLILSTQFVRASAAAGSLPPMFQPGGVGSVFFSAIRTSHIHHARIIA